MTGVRTDVNTRQTVLPRYLLGPQMLLHLLPSEERAFATWVKRTKQESGEMSTHGQRVVRSAFDRRVVDHDNALAPGYPAYPRDEPRAGNGLSWIDIVSGQGREFEEGGMWIQEQRQPKQGSTGSSARRNGTSDGRRDTAPLTRELLPFAPHTLGGLWPASCAGGGELCLQISDDLVHGLRACSELGRRRRDVRGKD